MAITMKMDAGNARLGIEHAPQCTLQMLHTYIAPKKPDRA
jgi:hypothetical protein